MKKIALYTVLALVIIILGMLFIFASKWKGKKIFDGPTDSKITNLTINALNGAVTASIPERFRGNYLDWKEVIPDAQILIDNFDDIKNEVNMLLAELDNIPEFDKLDPHQNNLANSDNKKWKTFFFKFYDEYNEENCKKCPKTAALLKKLPLDLAMFSIMEKGKVLIPHTGPWRGLLRLHLGVDIPPGAKITVDGEDYHWKEKELVLFDDTYTHSVTNPNGTRVVLFMDLKRDHIPSFFHSIARLGGKDYFNKVNKKLEESASQSK